MAEKWTKTSSPSAPSMKPYPFSFENHLTVPSANVLPPSQTNDGPAARRRVATKHRTKLRRHQCRGSPGRRQGDPIGTAQPAPCCAKETQSSSVRRPQEPESGARLSPARHPPRHPRPCPRRG